MEIYYDAFEIPVSISPLVLEVPAPRKQLIPKIPSAQKLVRREGIRQKKTSNDYVTQKKEVLSKTFVGT